MRRPLPRRRCRCNTTSKCNTTIGRAPSDPCTEIRMPTRPLIAMTVLMATLLALTGVTPASGAAQEMANLSVKIGSLYSTGKFSYRGKTLTLDDIEDVLKSSRDPAELKTLWEGWHAIAPAMRTDYARLIELANEGARELGYAEAGLLPRSWYDMPPAAFDAAVERLWSQLEPMYKNLQCYARARLNDKYGDAVQPRTGPIRADLLGNMWAQSWSNVYDLLAPANDTGDYDLTTALVAR